MLHYCNFYLICIVGCEEIFFCMDEAAKCEFIHNGKKAQVRCSFDALISRRFSAILGRLSAALSGSFSAVWPSIVSIVSGQWDGLCALPHGGQPRDLQLRRETLPLF